MHNGGLEAIVKYVTVDKSKPCNTELKGCIGYQYMASVYLHWYVFQCSWVQVNKIWAKAHISERRCYIKPVD